MIRDIILEYQKCYGLNGVEPTAVLPNEDGEIPETTVTGTGTGTSTGTNSGSQTSSYSTTTASGTTTTLR